MPDTTKLSCLCRVRSGGVNWIPDCRRQKIWSLNTFTAIVQFTPAHRTRHRQDGLLSGVAVWIESARPLDNYVLRRSASSGRTGRACAARHTPTQNALVRRSGRLNSHRLTRHRQHCFAVSGGQCELGKTELSPMCLACLFYVTLFRSLSKVKVIGQSSPSQDRDATDAGYETTVVYYAL